MLEDGVYRISDVDELKRRINNKWAVLSRAVIERVADEWSQRLHTIAFVLEADILSTRDVI